MSSCLLETGAMLFVQEKSCQRSFKKVKNQQLFICFPTLVSISTTELLCHSMVFCLSLYKASPTLLFNSIQVPTPPPSLLNHFFQFDVENMHRQIVCVRIYSCSSVYQCEWLSSFVKVWLWLCESPVERLRF